MKKAKVALIDNVNYCKFPEGIHDIKELITLINKNYHSFIELEAFVEDGCVAPFFIEEELKTEIQYRNPPNIRLIKESEVFILKREEYEERLTKVVQEKCVHCVHYSEDGCTENLQSFIEHIDLNGECYAFEKKC